MRDAIKAEPSWPRLGSVQIRTIHPEGHGWNMGAKYVIHAPHKLDLDHIAFASNGSFQ